MININTQELIDILDVTPSCQNIMLVGRHGIGKSQILTDYYEKKGMRVVVLFLGQMSDPGDLIGLPVRNGEEGKTDFMPPYWFPTDGKPVVLFLDELNRARPEVLQTIMDLALNRKLAGRSLPEGSRIISAVNDGEEYQLTDLDPALVSRFNVYCFCPTVAEWLLWASRSGIDQRVVDFLGESSVWLDGEEGKGRQADTGLDKTPDRRAWHKVSDIIKDSPSLGAIHGKTIAGIVGVPAAASFMASVAENRIVSGVDVLLDFDRVEPTLAAYRIHQLSQVNEALFRTLESSGIAPSDKAVAASNLKKYISLTSKSQKESMAHFASLFTSGLYPEAVAFIITETPEVYDNMMEYVNQI
ncbi:MAG: AAA family ATPase [Bacteroidales bacterium]|nr:AAA family ATPase [Bacteroidales bacterium]